MDDRAERLADLLADPNQGLDRVMAVIASIDESAPPEDEIVARLDELAGAVPAQGSAAGVLRHVFGTARFTGDVAAYYDPANSLVHKVIERRRGIPLTLAAIAAEVGRRRGVDLRPIGLPGHVLLGEGDEPDRWYDPFAAGAELDVDRCRALFARFNPIERFDPAMLAPMTATDVATRMVNNLRVAYLRAGRAAEALPVLELRADLAAAGVAERRELAEVLSAIGRFDRAADEFDRLAALDQARSVAHRARAVELRARRN